MVPGGLNMAVGKRLLAYDDFSESNNTVVGGKSLDIGGTYFVWDYFTSSTSTIVTNGKATVNQDNTSSIMATPVLGESDVIISCDITIPSSNNISILARLSQAAYVTGTTGDGIACRLDTTGTYIRQIKNGVYSTIATDTNKKATANQVYAVTVSVNGPLVTFITSLGTVTATTTILSNGRVGFYLVKIASNTASYIDNFKVESL